MADEELNGTIHGAVVTSEIVPEQELSAATPGGTFELLPEFPILKAPAPGLETDYSFAVPFGHQHLEHPTIAGVNTAIDEMIDAWFIHWFGASNLARATEAYKLIYRATEDLKVRLKGE